MYQVIKRDGKIAEFDISKISAAIKKAFEATNVEYNDDIIDFLALKVTADYASKVKDGKIQVEDIQDSVESVLSRGGYEEVAKAYILYRKQREKIRNVKATMLDYKELVNDYVNRLDWRVKENSTVTYSVGGLILSNSGAITANYWLSEVYDQEIADAHRNADIHLHDLSMLTGYCAGWSLKQLIKEGLGGIPGKITSAPAKHLATLCNQMVNFLGIMQNEWAGAQAFSSFDTYLASFVKYDQLSYDQVKKCIESFIYGVNTPSRWGTQAPFSNITLDWVVPKDLAEQKCIIGGKEMDYTYGDCQKEMDLVNRAFIEVMLEGDANGRGFQYPIPTYSITRNFDCQIRHALLLQLYQLRYGAFGCAFHVLPSASGSAGTAQEVGRILRIGRIHRFGGRGHHQYAENCLPFQDSGRILQASGQNDGYCRPFPKNQADRHYQAAERGTVSLHQALSRKLRQSLLHHRPCRHERSLPERPLVA